MNYYFPDLIYYSKPFLFENIEAVAYFCSEIPQLMSVKGEYTYNLMF